MLMIYTLHVQEYPIHTASLITHGVVAKPLSLMTIIAGSCLAHIEHSAQNEVFLNMKVSSIRNV